MLHLRLIISALGAVCILHLFCVASLPAVQDLTVEELKLVQQAENDRIVAIGKVIDSVISIYGEDRQGGGSGVIIDPSGIALTNHHVIMGAGISGWGGLADGKMYAWDLVGTDPGGDVAMIQLRGKDEFPFTPLGNSDLVQVGDWALAMGNPFVLTEDQVPTVTLGIVSGVKRYQAGAGQNQLVYGNCIQVDSSINPGNSGGPLFNMQGRVIGINGRGSFKARGRVNVGLGYAISANQIRNFIPDLLATKLVEHGTLDANFEDRGGKVVCSNVYEDTAIYKAGIRPGDELLEFENTPIKTANQFTNLICTLPEDWPAQLKIRKADGNDLTIHTRLFGLPYQQPEPITIAKDQGDKNPEEQQEIERRSQIINLMAATPGTVRQKDVNQKYAQLFIGRLLKNSGANVKKDARLIEIKDRVLKGGNQVGTQIIHLLTDGRFQVDSQIEGKKSSVMFDGQQFVSTEHLDGDTEKRTTLSLTEAKLNLPVVQAMGILAANSAMPFAAFGETLLDGSDKAQSVNAYRFKLLDPDDDWFFYWLSMVDENDDPQIQLLKACADKDGDQGAGAVSFYDWQTVEGIRIAQERKTVFGLGEDERYSFRAESVEVKTEFDESKFAPEKRSQPESSK